LDLEAVTACVLLVDDDARNLLALAELLRDERHRVVQARSGDEALAHLLREDFAVVLLDVRMPGLSGYETAALIRGRERSRAVPIIFLTAFNKDEAQIFEGYAAGAVDYLVKPVDPVVLKAKVAVFVDLYRKAEAIRHQAEAERALLRERLAAEQALRRREEEQALLLAAAPVALYKVPASGFWGAPRFVRGDVRAFTGFGREDFLNDGALWPSRLHPEDRERVAAEFARTAAPDVGAVTLEYRWLAADGRHRHILDRVTLVHDPASGGLDAIGTWVDITDRRAADERLRTAQRLETAGVLAGGLAHDFRNLLNVVFGRLEMATRGLGDREPGSVKHLEAAMQAAERGTAMTERLLAFARRQTMAPRALAINDTVRNTAALLEPSVGRRIEIELDLAEDPAPIAVADEAQFEAALLNLALNARDAMPDGGRLTIVTGAAVSALGEVPSDLAPGRYVTLAVADTGVGMDESTLRRAVEPFFTTKPAGVGTGLGLSAVYGFTRQSGGTLRIDSRLGEGTKVRLYLPAAAQAADDRGAERPMG
jgi:signal transduction histidine kinase